MTKTYKVTVRSVDYPTVLVQASSEEDACEIAAKIDGMNFTPGNPDDGVWEVEGAVVVSGGAVFTKEDVL
jgi:alkanesulfonate monooxygenase SsuD/methylene tetrahydromethanopterin reductase-like flavin-dependent oxidoreductase (luciferase family)